MVVFWPFRPKFKVSRSKLNQNSIVYMLALFIGPINLACARMLPFFIFQIRNNFSLKELKSKMPIIYFSSFFRRNWRWIFRNYFHIEVNWGTKWPSGRRIPLNLWWQFDCCKHHEPICLIAIFLMPLNEQALTTETDFQLWILSQILTSIQIALFPLNPLLGLIWQKF